MFRTSFDSRDQRIGKKDEDSRVTEDGTYSMVSNTQTKERT